MSHQSLSHLFLAILGDTGTDGVRPSLQFVMTGFRKITIYGDYALGVITLTLHQNLKSGSKASLAGILGQRHLRDMTRNVPQRDAETSAFVFSTPEMLHNPNPAEKQIKLRAPSDMMSDGAHKISDMSCAASTISYSASPLHRHLMWIHYNCVLSQTMP